MGVKIIDAPVIQHQNPVRPLNAGNALAMIILVVPGISLAMAALIFASVAVSTALVESSRIRIFGFFSNALAMHRRCFWPPDTLAPPLAIMVW